MGTLAGKRIAFVSHLDRNLVRFRLPIMKRLVSEGCSVYAVCPVGSSVGRFAECGVVHIPLPFKRLSFNPLGALRSIQTLRRILIGLQLDIAHSFTLRPNLYVNLAGALIPGLCLVNSVTGLGTLYINGQGAKLRLLRLIVNAATRIATRMFARDVVFQNPDDLSYYVTHRLCRHDQVALIAGSGVDPNEFSPNRFDPSVRFELREAWNIPASAVVVTMIARLVTSKGVLEYIETAKRASAEVVFVLIGEPDAGNPGSLSWAEIESTAAGAPLVLAGRQENIAEWLHASDIYALPSYREGIPRTVLEAMAMALPIATTDVPGCRETVVDGENGYLVPMQDVAALTAAIQRLCESESVRKRMGKRSREMITEKFATSLVVEQHVALYRRHLRNGEINDAC